ncbi:TIGR03751 family conjugal transfer lipoprotein [Halopseudomonas bauzanensis]|uniref:TIGR03751 family conjugal transfer lipoprotein n=1 Tax=Halopseudomonas bauzanensis TaxID=653930 RepID=UPI002555EB1B|nr:TIGR03751 family conjugal transfer lipoprotein [Halopseudomonas bauzanensis]
MSFPNSLVVILLVVALTGCATSKEELMPHGGQTMQDIWRQSAGGNSGDNLSQQALLDARSDLRRPIGDQPMVEQRIQYTRNAANEIYSQFARLPNPDLVMYVFPHVAGGEPVPVPGYSTVFPLYTMPEYAMPGEMAISDMNALDRPIRRR